MTNSGKSYTFSVKSIVVFTEPFKLDKLI